METELRKSSDAYNKLTVKDAEIDKLKSEFDAVKHIKEKLSASEQQLDKIQKLNGILQALNDKLKPNEK